MITALYRSSIDGRKFLYEAILSEDGEYSIPDNFTSRSAQVLQVYLKSLGIRMETVVGGDDYFGEKEDDENIVGYTFGKHMIFATPNEMWHVKKLAKLYKYYIKDNPGDMYDFNEVWEWMMENLPFKQKRLTDTIVKLFKNNLQVLT